jgi:hypothetical protein
LADDGLIQPNAIVEEYTVRAREANASLRKTWDSWIENGRPIYAFEQQLLDEIIPNDPEQRPQDTQRWRESMGAFLRREGWHESQPTGFTKSERTNLMHILGRLDEVQAYRTRFAQTHGEQKLQRHNNPNSVWRAFLKDIGELKPKEGTGKKGTLKESVINLQERVDELTEENARLTDAVNEGDWPIQINTILEKVDPKEVALEVFVANDTTAAIKLTEALVAEYCKCGNIMEVVDLDPKEVIQHNSQKARKLADAILNELDGQTDEPHDERLAMRLVNGRGAEAAMRLAAAIVAIVMPSEEVEAAKKQVAEKRAAEVATPTEGVFVAKGEEPPEEQTAASWVEHSAAPCPECGNPWGCHQPWCTKRSAPEAKVEETVDTAPLHETVGAVRAFVVEYFQEHTREDDSAETIQRLYDEKTGFKVGITQIRQFVREVAPQKRGRKKQDHSDAAFSATS